VRYGVVVVVVRPIRRSRLGAAHMHALADTHTHSQTHTHALADTCTHSQTHARTRRHTHALLDTCTHSYTHTHTHGQSTDEARITVHVNQPSVYTHGHATHTVTLHARPCYTRSRQTRGHATRTITLHARLCYTHNHATRTVMLHAQSRYTHGYATHGRATRTPTRTHRAYTPVEQAIIHSCRLDRCPM